MFHLWHLPRRDTKIKNILWLDKFQKANLARKLSWKWNGSGDWLILWKECCSDVSSRFFGGSVAWHPKKRLRRRLRWLRRKYKFNFGGLRTEILRLKVEIKFSWLTFSFKSWRVNWQICQISRLTKIYPAPRQDNGILKFGKPWQNLVDLKITGRTCLRELYWWQTFLQNKRKFAQCVRALTEVFDSLTVTTIN